MSTDRERSETPPDWEAMARYLADECPPEEADSIRAWLETHPADAEMIRTLDRITDRVSGTSQQPVDVDRALERTISRRNAAPVRPLRPHRIAPVQSRWRSVGLRAAAIVVVATGVGLLWRSLRPEPEPGSIAPAARTFATGIGERDTVRLPDSSLVVLGPRSTLVVQSSYNAPARGVTLRGEGYFDVRHDDAHGFVVHAAGATIRDVGTTFAVRATDSSGVRIIVRSGAVLLNAAGQPDAESVVLHEGDVGELQQGGRPVVKRGTASDDDVAWLSGRLVFRESGLRHIAAELKRWYGIELRIADSSLVDKHVTAVFAGEPLPQVLRIISLSLGATVELRGDTAVLRARGGRS